MTADMIMNALKRTLKEYKQTHEFDDLISFFQTVIARAEREEYQDEYDHEQSLRDAHDTLGQD